jgi:hypothetical protein
MTFDLAKFLPSFKVFAKFQTRQPSLNLAQFLPSSSLAGKFLVSVCFLRVPSMMSAKFELGCQVSNLAAKFKHGSQVAKLKILAKETNRACF